MSLLDAAELIRNNCLQSDQTQVNVVASPPRNTLIVDVQNPGIDEEDIKNFLESEEFSSIGIQDVIMQSNHICAITKTEEGSIKKIITKIIKILKH